MLEITVSRTLRRTIIAIGVVLFTAFAPGVGIADTLDDIRKADTIKIGVGVMGLKPWIWQNEDGSYGGLEFEMLQKMLPRLGISKFEYVPVDFDALIPGLQAKRFDIIFSAMTITEERRLGSGIEFSRPYYFESDRIAVLEDSPYRKPEELKDKIIGVVVGTVEEMRAHEMVSRGWGSEVKSFDDFAAPFLALQNKQVDAVVADFTSFRSQKKVTPNIRVIGQPMPPVPKPEWKAKQDAAGYKFGGSGIGVRKEDPTLLAAINAALDAMDEAGERQKILENYGLWDESLSRDAMMSK